MDDRKVLLVTSIGKRVQLIKHLQEKFKVIGVDAGNVNCCRYFVNKFYKIPKAVDKNYIKELLEICKKEKVQGIIPLYEGEFYILDKNRNEFENIGTKLILSSERIIDICKDKNKTFKYFTEEGIKNPKVYEKNELDKIISSNDTSVYPMFIKPADGMGSSNAFKISNKKELIFFKDYVHNGIIQQCIEGDEYTVDALVDFKGNPVYIIPRIRIEVRSGEVVKSRTVHDEEIINTTKQVINSLNKLKDENNNGAIGPLTIQFFKTKKGEMYLLEINPRFGGGVPLSFECGADYSKALYDILDNKKVSYNNQFKEITMLRFDDAVFIDGEGND